MCAINVSSMVAIAPPCAAPGGPPAPGRKMPIPPSVSVPSRGGGGGVSGSSAAAVIPVVDGVAAA